MADNAPLWSGGSAFLHGFARGGVEGPPSGDPSTWWGSAKLALPGGVTQTVVRLQAEDGAHSRGILYRRGGETTVLVFAHPRGDFSSHYLTPVLLDAGEVGRARVLVRVVAGGAGALERGSVAERRQ